MDTNNSGEWSDSLRRIAELLQESHEAESFSKESRSELNELLRSNEANREFAAQYLLDGESLKEILSVDEMAALASGQPGHSLKTHSRFAFQRKFSTVLAWAASIALVAILFFVWSSREPVAYVQDEAGAIFAEGAAPDEGKMEKETYSLISGLIAVKFSNGVSMTVKGPAEFEIVDAFRVRLSRGSIRAIAPDSGHGFVIETPEVDIQDLGTEFGVSVDGNTGDSEVHVFDGQVDVKERQARAIIASLEFGDSASILDGEVNMGGLAHPGQFLTPADVSYSRWFQSSESIQRDPDVVFYYGFDRQTEADRILPDESTVGESIDGKIEGARWVSGRWPEKRALLFDQPSDSVILEIPEELPEFTFAAWINLDRLDEPLTSIMNSLDWKPGSMHMQISRSRGTLMPGIYPKVHKKKGVPVKRIPTGQWAFVVAVVDAEKRTARTWINGELAIEGHFKEVPTIKPGVCLLGSFSTNVEGDRSRGFQGRMDEVILWRRTLDKEEIWSLYRSGRPQSAAIRDS